MGCFSYSRLRKNFRLSIASSVDSSQSNPSERVAPLKPVTVRRLELTAAVSSVRISQQLRREFGYHIDQEYF